MRLALKVCLGTTMLGGVGGGGYYAANSGWLPALTSPSAGTPATASANGQPAELDAVASAWAQPAATDSVAGSSADFSSTARSASVSLARAEESAAGKAPDERYGIYPSTLTTTASSEAPTPIDVPAATVSTVAEQQGVAADLVENAAVARGQEPAEVASPTEPTTNANATVSDIAVDQEIASASTYAEPRQLNVATGETPQSPSTQRAREAFQQQPAAAMSMGDDPYGPMAASPGDSAAVNPFAAKPMNTRPATASDGLIETLPSAPGDGTAGTAGLNRAGDSLGSTLGGSARATADNASDRSGGAQPAHPVGTLPGNGFANMPGSVAGQPGSGFGDSTSLEGTGKPGERALEGPQNPALLVQKFAPGEIQVGKAAKFVIQVRNVGSQAASDVVVRDEVPQGTRLVSTSPNAQPNGSQLVWQLGKLSAGEERTLEMQLMPTTEGEIGSVATVSYAAQASVKTRCTMPQLAIRMTAPERVMIGQEQRVKIEIRNPGTGDASGVMLFENVPQNVRHAAGPALEFEIGTLRAGETRELELALVAEKAGKVVNVLSARADGNLQVQQQVEFEVIAPALEVAVNGPERRYLERPATYAVSVENPGTAPAHDVQIVTKLPKGLRFVRANNMGEYDSASHAVYWSLAELPEGESGTVELVAMPVETGAQMLEVESRASQGLTDQATQQILVEGLAAIMFEVRDLEDPIEVGGESGYEIRVVNQGTKAATNLRVAVNLPPGLQALSAEGETQYTAQGNVLVFEPLGQLSPKADTVYRIRVQAIQAGDQRVTVEVHTDDLGQPIRREESTRVFGDE
jgi:uncharacterized repeat protein (TIGR01451 family)